MKLLDRWMDDADKENSNWLWRHAQNHRNEFLRIVTSR